MVLLSIFLGVFTILGVLLTIPTTRKAIFKWCSIHEDDNLKTFEKLVENGKWKKEYIGYRGRWVCEDNDLYQIDLSSEHNDFEEEWANIYPNRKAFSQPVLLKIRGVEIKQITFVYCDETRIFVPLPEKVAVDSTGSCHFEWNKNSLEFKLAKIIGRYYIYKNIEGIAEMSKIKIV